MRALFHSPYFDSLGGGERYIFTLINLFQDRGHQVDITLDQQESLRQKTSQKFNLHLSPLGLVPNFSSLNLIAKYRLLSYYDLTFSVSDGSLPFLFGSNYNIIHFQVPFHNLNSNNLINKIKKKSINKYISNSHFTKDFVDQEYDINSSVVYPPIDINHFKSVPKKNQILYVGRFSTLLQDKGHVRLIEAFKKFTDVFNLKYRLFLAGSTEVGSQKLVNQLRRLSKGYPIEIITDPPYEDIHELYHESRFFWALAGIDANEVLEPEKCEHFGMSLVEAMAAGCVPLAIRKGGYREIITPTSGILCDSIDELITNTKMVHFDKTRQDNISIQAIKRAAYFSTEKFKTRMLKLIPRTLNKLCQN